MKKPIQISIPTPCHENWDAMTPADKGRFCGLCQKNVIDYTKASDREIVESLQQGPHLCGRFREDQLDRDLVIIKKKSTIWAAASAAMVSLITAGTTKTYAQEKPGTEFAQNKDTKGNPVTPTGPYTIIWNVKDYEGNNIQGARVSTGSEKTSTDANGNFSLTVNTGDIIRISYKGKKTVKLTIDRNESRNIRLKTPEENKIRVLSGRFF